MNKLIALLEDWKVVALLCATIGLMPFFPEPHIIGKIRWILGGANGMGLIDWLDFVFHAFPWVLLIWWLNRRLSS